MAWARLDDTFYPHPKVRRAGNEAIGVHCRAISYSAGALTDGKIDRAWLSEVAGRSAAKVGRALVDSGLWELNGEGWVIHDYLEYNPSRAQVLEKRRAESERKARGR